MRDNHYLTGDFKGGLVVVFFKSHPLLTYKTDALAKWNRITEPDGHPFEHFGVPSVFKFASGSLRGCDFSCC